MDGPWTWTVRGRVAVPPRLPRGCSAEARQRGTTLRRKSVRGLEGPGPPEGRGAAAVFDAGEAAEIAGSTGRSEDPSDARDGERDERTASRCRGVPCGYSDGRVAAPPRGAAWIFRRAGARGVPRGYSDGRAAAGATWIFRRAGRGVARGVGTTWILRGAGLRSVRGTVGRRSRPGDDDAWDDGRH